MLGYLLSDQPGLIAPPASTFGPGWFDTGDIVDIERDGFVKVCGRVRRFAKIGGEMVSLAVTEDLVATIWPSGQHAVVALPDSKKGEQLVLVTNVTEPNRQAIVARVTGIAELSVPKKIIPVPSIPFLGSGKIDYPTVTEVAREALGLQSVFGAAQDLRLYGRPTVLPMSDPMRRVTAVLFVNSGFGLSVPDCFPCSKDWMNFWGKWSAHEIIST